MDSHMEMSYGMNNLYIHPMHIYRQLQVSYRTTMTDIDPLTIYEWAAWAEMQLLADVEKLNHRIVSLGFKKDGKIQVVDKRVPVPLFVRRIVELTDANGKVIPKKEYTYNGSYIYFNSDEYNGTEITADVYMMEYDPEEMVPLIRIEHADAVMKYCIYKLFEEDITLGRISVNEAVRITQNYQLAMIEAASIDWSVTRDDFVELVHAKLDLSIDYQKIVK